MVGSGPRRTATGLMLGSWSPGSGDLPIPDVLDVGDAFEGAFAISVRHHGPFLEETDVDDAATVAEPFARLLAALRSVGSAPDAPSVWYPPGAQPASSTWRQWLLAGLVDDPK